MFMEFSGDFRYVRSLLSVRKLLRWNIGEDVSREQIGENVDLAGANTSATLFKL